MTDPTPKRFPFAKVVIVMVVAFLVGLGLCGLDFVLGSHGYGQPHAEFSVGPLDGVSLIVMVLSAAGLVLSLLVWALAAIVGGIASSGKDKGAEKLVDGDNDPSDHDGKV
jgi:hypothetical protein